MGRCVSRPEVLGEHVTSVCKRKGRDNKPLWNGSDCNMSRTGATGEIQPFVEKTQEKSKSVDVVFALVQERPRLSKRRWSSFVSFCAPAASTAFCTKPSSDEKTSQRLTRWIPSLVCPSQKKPNRHRKDTIHPEVQNKCRHGE